MERLAQDLRFAVRLLWKEPSFTVTTIATLALCLAANTAIFAVVNSVLLRPLPFPEPERLVTIFNAYPGAGVGRAPSSVPDYFDRLKGVPSFSALATYRESGVTIGGEQPGEAERVASLITSPSLFPLLGATPMRGRLFTEDEAEPGRERKVVLSYELWQRRFGGRDDVVGQDMRISGVPYTIVGVMPRGFVFIDPDVQVWMPAAFTPEERQPDKRHNNNWQQIARLADGATLEQAQGQIDAVNARNLEEQPAFKTVLTNAGFHTQAVPTAADLVRQARPALLLLWGGAILVLVIGCVNVANLVLVRASARVRELATRAALGASIGRLSRQLFTEALLLAAAGGAAGVVLGAWVLRSATVFGFAHLPRASEIALDARAILATLSLTVLSGLIVGVLPALMLRRANLAQIVREEGRSGTASRSARTVRRLLVTSQVAFALVLLAGAGLLLASFQRVLAVNPGFVPDHLLTGAINLPVSRYADEAAIRSTIDRLLERVRAIPGVQHAAATSTLPFGGSYSDSVILAEGHQMAPGESLISPSRISVTDGYFETMQIRLEEGRFFDANDGRGREQVIIIDKRLARHFWPGQSAIGRRMYRPSNNSEVVAPPTSDDKFMRVVGVVDEVRLTGLVDNAEVARVGAYYHPFPAAPFRSVSLAIRTTIDPSAITGAVRAELAGIDPELPFFNVRTMTDRIDESLVDRRTPMLLAVIFAAAALLLAAIGIYGVLAYQVAQRAREIGIRIALGAASGSIFGMILREGALIVGIGSVAGILGAFLLRGTLQSQLYGVGAAEPWVLIGVAGVLLVVALVACVLPARRAARTDPVSALAE